jgi:hypothetical protein
MQAISCLENVCRWRCQWDVTLFLQIISVSTEMPNLLKQTVPNFKQVSTLLASNADYGYYVHTLYYRRMKRYLLIYSLGKRAWIEGGLGRGRAERMVARWYICIPKILILEGFWKEYYVFLQPFGIFYRYLVYTVVLWYIFFRFGMLH